MKWSWKVLHVIIKDSPALKKNVSAAKVEYALIYAMVVTVCICENGKTLARYQNQWVVWNLYVFDKNL